MNYTRKKLIEICERAITPQSKWHDRDSFSAQIGIAKSWMMLKAGCKFEVLTKENEKENEKDLITDDITIWIKFWAKTFMWFENLSDEDCPDGLEHENGDSFRYYLPTEKRLDEANGKDWY